MAQKDKVLKVSFGAFSCTLEGFDDPVETLKEVTEYFRALSASDPGFGDEPKLPDTENLARLVQQDDSKSVNIRTNESGSVMLRAEDAEFVPSETEEGSTPQTGSHTEPDGLSRKRKLRTPGDPAEGSVADKLQRIRAVVSSADAEPSSDDLAEDDSQTAQFFARQINDTPPNATEAEPEDTPETDTGYKDGDDEVLQSLDQLRTPPAEPSPVPDDPDGPDQQDDASLTGATIPDQPVSEQDDDTVTTHDQLMRQVMNTLKGSGSGEQAAPPSAAEQDDPEDDFSQPYVLRPDQMISDGTDSEDDEWPEVSPPQVEKIRKSIPESDEIALNRLMAATEERMGAPETADQRATYSQLRAAVAATGGASGADESKNDAETAYQNDLASVVHPDSSASGGTTRPAARDDTLPLQLVKEQRVAPDGASAIAGPVRPRRVHLEVAEHQPDTGSTDGNFAKYAEQQGTTELPDILEAAAAYMSFVEGRNYFTRPQLMNTLRQNSFQLFHREDCLRAFGSLLRQGKITKVGSGRYAASDRTGFRPAG